MGAQELLDLMAEAEDRYVLTAETMRKEGMKHETENKTP